MGLAESKYQAYLREVTGNEVSDVGDWKSGSGNLDAMKNLEEKCLKFMLGIFRVIATDKIGKKAAAETI